LVETTWYCHCDHCFGGKVFRPCRVETYDMQTMVLHISLVHGLHTTYFPHWGLFGLDGGCLASTSPMGK
jgi:hypothetical protein